MMQPYFSGLARSIDARIQAQEHGPVARKRFSLEIARLGARLFTPGQSVAWCGVLAPFDLLNAMGVTSCFVEFVGAILSSTGKVGPLLEGAEEAGFSTDSCSYHRAVMGATLSGLMPEPEFLVATSAPCSGGVAVIESLARHFDKDLFVLHVPQRDDDASVDFLAEQIQVMVGFVEAHTGRPLDPEALARAVDATNRARALLVEVQDLARALPSPVRRRDLVNFGVVVALLMGTEAAVDVARAFRDEFAANVAQGVAGTPGEHVRLMWLQNRIQFKQPIEELLSEQLGAAVVIDELNDVTWGAIDPADPWRGMARRILSSPLLGSAPRRVANLQRLARDYRVQGAINPCHWGCRQGTGARGLIERGLSEVGVPVLNLEVDCVDPRSFAEGQLRTRVEAFVEMLEG